jgi:hypothetical protein
MMIGWWSKYVGVILSVLVCDIWTNVLLQTNALVGPLYIVNWNAQWNSEIRQFIWFIEKHTFFIRYANNKTVSQAFCKRKENVWNRLIIWAALVEGLAAGCIAKYRFLVGVVYISSLPRLQQLCGRSNLIPISVWVLFSRIWRPESEADRSPP